MDLHATLAQLPKATLPLVDDRRRPKLSFMSRLDSILGLRSRKYGCSVNFLVSAGWLLNRLHNADSPSKLPSFYHMRSAKGYLGRGIPPWSVAARTRCMKLESSCRTPLFCGHSLRSVQVQQFPQTWAGGIDEASYGFTSVMRL